MTQDVAHSNATPAAGTADPRVVSHRLRALATGPRPAADRVFFHSVWFQGHNNQRYLQLLSRLDRVDPFLTTCSDRRVVRGLQFRSLRATRRAWLPAVVGAAGRRYQHLFAIDLAQIPHFRGTVVADVDDPKYTPEEASFLNSPNVRAYVTTTEAAARRYTDLGVTTPHHVVPQGVDFSSLDAGRVEEVAARQRRPGDVVVGFVAAWLLTGNDRNADSSVYNTDHLLGLWDEIRARVSNARLWLIGEPSASMRARCEGRDDVLLLGRLSRGDVLAHLSCFDIALYPRRVDHAPFAVKIAEYLGMGLPTVAYDLELTQMVEQRGAGVLAKTPRNFVDAVSLLAGDAARRASMSAAAKAAGKELDWDILAERYSRDILDVHLV